MNKTELISKISKKSGISQEKCMIVIHTLEEVLNEEFSHAGSAGKAFDKAYRIIDFFKRKKISPI